MQIVRITEQGPQSLVEFYQDIGGEGVRGFREAQGMVELLAEIATLVPGSYLWGMTSHRSLIVLRQDTSSPDHPIVTIHPTPAPGWHIACVMPPELAPWAHAEVSGATADLDEAVRRVRLAFFWAKLMPTP